MDDILINSLLALFVAFCWGSNSHLVRLGMQGQNTFSGLFIRASFAFPPLIVIGLLVNELDVWVNYFSLAIFPVIFVSVVLIVIGDSIFAYGLTKFPVKVILPITSVYPLFTAILLILLGQEGISLKILLGTVVIVIGVYLVTRGKGKDKIEKKALIYGLVPAVAWGSSVVAVRYVLETSPGAESISLTGIRIFFIGLMGLILYFFTRKNNPTRKNNTENSRTNDERITSIKFLGLSGLVGWTIGGSLFFYTVQNIGASIVTPISSTNPIIAVLIGTIFGLEYITEKQSIGVLSCVLGTLIIII